MKKPLLYFILFIFLAILLFYLAFTSRACRYNGVLSEAPEVEPEPRPEEAPAVAELPQFPWPPPTASAFLKIPNSLLVRQDTISTFGDCANRMETALSGAGYTQISYYAVPDGFAMVTQLEQIDDEGIPKEPGRWSMEYQPIRKFSLRHIIESLFTARKGLWRVTVFIVTSHDFKQKDVEITLYEAEEWLEDGMIRLPPYIAQIRYSDNHFCTALVYEFEKTEPDQDAEHKLPSEITGKQHLERGGIWKGLGGT
jgi:hypothetical protein